ncbi:GNAT family N-acetyltransferase [Tenacibaculum sp. IB213877]|uniref:GNAT family N-acetyltransferase n=1 Tax=Tenacibaculum sp. IB213877 TaxID=3097351 RepID=UPI002A5A8D52|nr:GNAT family N-acetyltransferase [Tenacibaculum sp. IB213877]MDY0780526.1 GNAT family N-acetyltransferase [Tenacibaculum sp. IB213877]
MDIVTRPAKIEELETLLKFEQGIIEYERQFDDALKDEHFHYYDLKTYISSENAEVVVAVDNDQLIGSGYGRIVNSKSFHKHSKHVYVGFMFVKPEYRGKGVSGKILEALKNWATSKNIYEMKLDVYADNVSALNAYEKFGFKKDLINMRLKISE